MSSWQTLGPFFDAGLLRPGDADLSRLAPDGPAAEGELVEVTGRVLEEGGAGVPGALLEIWQANAAGRYHHPLDRREPPLDPHFKGFGRTVTDCGGQYRFRTVKPGPVPGRGNRWQAPHVLFSIFAAGLLRRLITRLYFPDEPHNDADPVLSSIADPAARATLIARREAISSPATMLTFDIVLRGEGETVFFTG